MWKIRLWKNNKFRIGFVDIGLEKFAVAARRMAERPSRCSNKKGSKTSMSIIRMRKSLFSMVFGTRWVGSRQIGIYQPWEPHRASSVWVTTNHQGPRRNDLNYCSQQKSGLTTSQKKRQTHIIPTPRKLCTFGRDGLRKEGPEDMMAPGIEVHDELKAEYAAGIAGFGVVSLDTVFA